MVVTGVWRGIESTQPVQRKRTGMVRVVLRAPFLIVLHTLSLQLEELSFGPYFIRKYNFGRLICAMADERTNRQRYVTIEAPKYVLREAADIIETSKYLMVSFGMSCYLLAKWSPRSC